MASKSKQVSTNALPAILQQYSVTQEIIGKLQLRVTVTRPNGEDRVFLIRGKKYDLRGLVWRAHNGMRAPQKRLVHRGGFPPVTWPEGLDYWAPKMDTLAKRGGWQSTWEASGYLVPLQALEDPYGNRSTTYADVSATSRGYAGYITLIDGPRWIHTKSTVELLAWLRSWRLQLADIAAKESCL